MKRLLITLALLFVGITTIAFALVFFEPAQGVVERIVEPGPLSRGHAYLSERCEACHTASVGVTVAQCTTCHATSVRLLGVPVRRPPFPLGLSRRYSSEHATRNYECMGRAGAAMAGEWHDGARVRGA
jgi:hypothetical protein